MSELQTVTVDDLLPALIELASIQHDLINLDLSSEGSEFAKNPLYIPKGRKRSETEESRRALLLRSREVLSWLLAVAGVT